LRLVLFGDVVGILEGLHGEDTTHDTGVVGKHEGSNTAHHDEENGAHTPKPFIHFVERLTVQRVSDRS
jgi:hypothetical protein